MKDAVQYIFWKFDERHIFKSHDFTQLSDERHFYGILDFEWEMCFFTLECEETII